MHHLQADVMPVHQLNIILSEVQLKLTKHSRLKLPLESVGDGIWKFYDIIKVDCLIYENKIFTLMTIPLVEKGRVFDVYKIHSLPLLHPIVKKHVTFKLESPYMAISQDQLFVTYPSLDKILTCQMAQGSYCEINKLLFAIDKTKQCAIYLFKQQRSQINQYCKMDFINQTTDLVISLDNSYWVTSIVKPTHLHVSCLMTSYYKELKHPLDITYLGDSCEGFTSTMLLPASNVIKINDPI